MQNLNNILYIICTSYFVLLLTGFNHLEDNQPLCYNGDCKPISDIKHTTVGLCNM